MALLVFDVDDCLYVSGAYYDICAEELCKLASLRNSKPFDYFKLWYDAEKKKTVTAGGLWSLNWVVKQMGLEREDIFLVKNKIDYGELFKEDRRLQVELSTLSKRHVLVVVSNGPTKGTEALLASLGVKQFFKKIYGADMFKVSKPNSEIFSRVVTEMGFNFSDSISIGDSVTKEIEPAKALGMKTILVKQGIVSDQKTGVADVTIGSIYDITQAVEELL